MTIEKAESTPSRGGREVLPGDHHAGYVDCSQPGTGANMNRRPTVAAQQSEPA